MGNTSSAARARSAGYPDIINKIVVWGHTKSWLIALSNKGSSAPLQPLKFSTKIENAVVPPGVVTALKKNSGKVAVKVGTTVELKDISVVKNSKQYQKIGTPVRLVSSSTGSNIEISYYYQAVSSSSKKTTQTKSKTVAKPKKPATNTVVPMPAQDPNEFQWNLPPHKWSMPFRAGYDPKNMPDNSPNSHTVDKYRRGRIWWKATDRSLTITDSN